ncbi:MAG: DUF2027 domain-containing protein [Bacteroidetes bacterium]|nr:MAG: DUF2027 domain-containing protein [Bacteroidota bacterium]REJ99919.1 MAG: DUF2027 domain-containing protein [Bacteroidota bacterium]REK35901.1 MAG: DUF2027 domain-containing protein [Bacteroidota bacterium]REK50622.1 MAG: DUF2027 domain-containing protein [Bacteroidota bacterium]
MKFKPGDRVRFLNDNIDGTVSRILANERVEVNDNHGFLHVVPASDLVHIDFSFDKEDLNVPDLNKTQGIQNETSAQNSLAHAHQELPILATMENDETIYAAIRLHNEKALLTSDIDMILVNNTIYTIAYSISRQIGNLRQGVGASLLAARNEKFIGVFSQDELHRFNGFEFQFLFYSENEFKPRPPAIKQLIVTPSDFLNPDYHMKLQGRAGEVLLMPLISFSDEPVPDISGLIERYRAVQSEEEKRSREASAKHGKKREKFVLLSREKVVDLHIEELVKDSNGMSNGQIIAMQINHFTKELDTAIIHKLHKITFIHGVGEGILKNAIREELKKYPGLRWQEAPQEKFGYGATEIELF